MLESLSCECSTGRHFWSHLRGSAARQGRCHCFCNLSKPKQRLQRLLHSISRNSSHGLSVNKEVLGKTVEGQGPDFALNLTQGKSQTEKQLQELRLLVDLLPFHLRHTILTRHDILQLIEVVLDLGRPPYARFPQGDVRLSEEPVSQGDLEAAVNLVGDFGDDNRAGINRTLHRISCMRNRDGNIVGLTCRLGRAISGCASLAADFAIAGKSLLILGKPGDPIKYPACLPNVCKSGAMNVDRKTLIGQSVGKTTAIRELARLLADEIQKRVVLVDTSNEIGGDGDIPHIGVGASRRMQVVRTDEQHRVMIEAVENHMPEVIVIDEIGTEAEALAARTIAQRGVQLIATAHGGHLENIIKNPSLRDLVGGVESVTLGDDEARRRGSQKLVQERAAPPTFDVAIELLDRRKWCIYPDIGKAVDSILSGREPPVEVRQQDQDGMVHQLDCRTDSWSESAREAQAQASRAELMSRAAAVESQENWQGLGGRSDPVPGIQPLYVHLVGIEGSAAEKALSDLGQTGERLILTSMLESADVVLALRSQMRSGSWAREAAKLAAIPVYAIKSSTAVILARAFETLLGLQPRKEPWIEARYESDTIQYQNHVVSRGSAANEHEALEEAQEALEKVVLPTMKPIELLPRTWDVVRKQTELVEHSYGLATQIIGKGMQVRLRILPSIALSSSTLVGHSPVD